jgi:hypothetical protein
VIGCCKFTTGLLGLMGVISGIVGLVTGWKQFIILVSLFYVKLYNTKKPSQRCKGFLFNFIRVLNNPVAIKFFLPA